MWVLRNGRHIRVSLDIDRCWSNDDIWQARNLFARFKILGYDDADCSSLASAAVWKRKWAGTVYNSVVESQLASAAAAAAADPLGSVATE